jgi:hypothetical protein
VAAPDVLDARLAAMETRNLALYGYGVKGFTLSLIETAMELTGGDAPGRMIADILAAGREMLGHPVEPLPGVDAALAELADCGGAALAGRSGKDALVALGNVYRDYAREHPGRYEAATGLRLDPETAAASAGPRNSQMIRAILRGYHLSETDQTHAVRLIGSTFHGYIRLEMGGSFDHSRPDSQQSWIRIMDGLDVLLRHWPSE